MCIGPVAGTVDGNSSSAVGGMYQGPDASKSLKKRKGPPQAIQVMEAKRFAGERKVLQAEKDERRLRAASLTDMSKRINPVFTAGPGDIE